MKESERTVILADEQNIRPLLVFSEEVINNANVAALDRVMTPTFEHGSLPQGDVYESEDLKQIILHLRLIFPAWHETIEQVIAEGDLVFRRMLCSGTNTGACSGIAATGKSVTVLCLDCFRIAQGKIVEHWGYDWVEMMQQLSAIPVVA